ncbi:UMP kinase [Mycoplasmoides genitalium]|uniref:UMP kinase n=1 Tax=Mycoplasmoides genitalium TaxID=2097 RepID=UPI00027B3173|nr:UMP kinase [Mycoplasmoides genitalium]AFQ03758.1 uridylate kinase [Mycoplasmoides genitalium M6282]
MHKSNNKIRQRIIIKLSGAGLTKENSQPFSNDFFETIINQLKVLKESYQVGIVIGGGNIIRGNNCQEFNIAEYHGHQLGIIATVVNGYFLKAKLDAHNLKSALLSAISCPSLAVQILSQQTIDKAFEENDFVIFSGGTGNPYFSTDTALALRAVQTKAVAILIGKNGVDGVYTADPKKDKNATFLPTLNYDHAIKNDLKIMDITAFTMCKENNLKIIIFNINTENALLDALNKKGRFTIIENN